MYFPLATTADGVGQRSSPVRGFWDITIPHHCDEQRKFEMAAAVVNIIVDLVVILLPLPTVWRLKLPRRQRWALSGVFMLGFLYGHHP